MARLFATIYQTTQAQQFGIKIGNAAANVIGCAHTAEKVEHRYAQRLREHRQAVHGQHIIHTNSPQESTFSRHVCPGYYIIVSINYFKIVRYCLDAQERMINAFCPVNHSIIRQHFGKYSLPVVEPEHSFRNVCVKLPYDFYPFAYVIQVCTLPFQKSAHNKEIVKKQYVKNNHCKPVSSSVQTVGYAG